MGKAKHPAYLNGPPALQLKSQHGQLHLTGYCDANGGAGDPDKRRPASDDVFLLAGGPLSFALSLRKLIAHSSVKAELLAMAYCANEAVYLLNILQELGYYQFKTVTQFGESTGALYLAGNPSYL